MAPRPSPSPPPSTTAPMPVPTPAPAPAPSTTSPLTIGGGFSGSNGPLGVSTSPLPTAWTPEQPINAAACRNVAITITGPNTTSVTCADQTSMLVTLASGAQATVRSAPEAQQCPSLQSLSIKALAGNASVTFDGEPFTACAQLKSLSFENVAFVNAKVRLETKTLLTKVALLNTNAKDLSLMAKDNSPSSLELTLQGTVFNALPAVLYERKYTALKLENFKISSTSPFQTLQRNEYETLQANLNTLDNSQASIRSMFALNATCPKDTLTATTTVETPPAPSASRGKIIVCVQAEDTNRQPLSPQAPPDSSARASGAAKSSSGLSAGAIAGIVIAVLVVALVALVFARGRTRRGKASASERSPTEDSSIALLSRGDAGASKSNDVSLSQCELPVGTVSATKAIGRGRVWLGERDGAKVVLHRVEAEKNSSAATRSLRHDAKRFSTLSHANVIRFLGVTWVDGTDFTVVVEHMARGTLSAVLRDTEPELTRPQQLQMCVDVAMGLVYLHANDQYVKRLTSREVLVAGDGVCKINLLETARVSDRRVDVPIVFGAGELAWTAPELVLRDAVDVRQSNVFALGVLLSEILTRHAPYADAVDRLGCTLADVELFACLKARGKTPLAPHEDSPSFHALPRDVRDVISQCLSLDPRQRPSAERVLHVLLQSQHSVPP